MKHKIHFLISCFTLCSNLALAENAALPETPDQPIEVEANVDESAVASDNKNEASEDADSTDEVNPAVLTSTVGFDFSSGRYGSLDKTLYRSTQLNLSYEATGYGLEITIPHVSATSPVGSIAALDAAVILPSGQPVIMQTQSGLGDIWVGGTYYFLDERENAPVIDIKTRLKLPTASAAKGLGTGKADLSIQLDRTQTDDKFTFAVSGGYIKSGKIAALALRNTWFGSTDISLEFAEGHTAGAMLYGQQSIAEGVPHQAELTVYWSYKPHPKSPLTARAYLLKGLSQGSPDYGTGVSCALSF